MKKTALITGATSGIGEAVAKQLAAAGYDLIITGRRNERLEAVRASVGGEKVTALCFDIRDREATQKTLSGLGDIDILVNNAGLAAGLEHIQDGDTDDWEAMIDTNVKGLLWATRVVAPGMAARKSGHIINIGSIAGTQVYENGGVYCASKHAVHALSHAMRIDLLSAGVRVTEIRPGMVETEFSKVRFHGDGERAANVYKGVTPLTAEDVADAVIWAATRPAHVNIDEIMLTCTAQADAFYTHRK